MTGISAVRGIERYNPVEGHQQHPTFILFYLFISFRFFLKDLVHFLFPFFILIFHTSPLPYNSYISFLEENIHKITEIKEITCQF